VIRSDTSGDGELEVLGLCETLSGQVARVEAGWVLEERQVFGCFGRRTAW
jgi:hypothetical protein